MNRKPIMIIRQCVKCPAEFAVKAITSRAIYCPACRAEIKGVGLVVNLDRSKFERVKKAA